VPRVLLVNGYEFFFRSNDCPEPPHVHVRGNGGTAKVWLDSGKLARSSYNRKRTVEMLEIVRSHQAFLLGKWGEFCGRA